MELDKCSLEHAKNDLFKYSTEEKTGSYQIEVYSKRLIIPKDRWLLLLLQHNSFCWENVTAMRFLCKSTNFTNLQDVFFIQLADEYQEAITHLNMLLGDPTVVRPGDKSIVLITPLNTGWCWNDKHN